MKPLIYNNPERAKERAEVVPPDEGEIKHLITNIKHYIGSEYTLDIIQRLLDDYENLRQFKENAGGWQGLNAFQVNYEIVASCVCSKCGSPMEIDYSKVLTSMPPKRQVNCINENCKSVAYINF